MYEYEPLNAPDSGPCSAATHCVSPEHNAYRILVGTPEGKRPLGILRCRQEASTKVVLK
jgi:hypothetical protein